MDGYISAEVAHPSYAVCQSAGPVLAAVWRYERNVWWGNFEVAIALVIYKRIGRA